MSSIENRLNFFLLLSLGLLITFGSLQYFSLGSYNKSIHQLHHSEKLTDFLKTLNIRRRDKKVLPVLRDFHLEVIDETRRKDLSNIVESYALDQKTLFTERRRVYLLQEEVFRKNTEILINAYNKRIYFYLYALILSVSLLMFIILLFCKNLMFKPTHDLGKRMNDFLYNRYNYEFQAPAPNEMGILQSTFNSLAQKVLNYIDELKDLDNAKSEFLNIASHELRTPLTSIKGSLSLLKSGMVVELNDKSKNLVLIAENETDRLIRLINDLLDLAKIEAREMPMDLSWTPINDLFFRTFESLKAFALNAGVEIERVTDDDVDVFIDSDKTQQILTNLISNAIKYSPKGAKVYISTKVEDSQVTVYVKDLGVGISKENQKYIFQKFRQVKGKQNPIVKGTGLGLAIVKAVVEQQGGKVGIESEINQGSTFYFTIKRWRPRKKGKLVNKESVA